jgi:hypothetical protein
VPDGRYLAVDPGSDDTCAIRLDGTLACWGEFAAPPPTGTFRAVDSGGGQDRCAIRTEGTLACWRIDFGDNAADDEDPVDGEPSASQLPDGRFTMLVMSEFGRPCGLREDGTVVCWGEGEPPSEISAGPFVALGDGCGVLATGALECFILGETGGALLPAGLFLTMSGTADRGCAVRVVGDLACWGIEDADSGRQMRTPPGRYTAVSVREYVVCALRADDRAVCWGYDDEGLIPAPSVQLDLAPIAVTRVVDVAWRGIPLARPISTYDVEYRWLDPLAVELGDEASQPAWTGWLNATTTRSARLEVDRGGRYCVRARPHDADGLTGTWMERCTFVPLDDRELQAQPAWTPVEGEDYFMGTALRATMKGATLRLTDGGLGSIGIFGTTCGGCGTFVIRSYSPDCERDGQGRPVAGCPFDDEEVALRGVRKDSVMVVATDNGEEGFGGPIDIVVTSNGKPVIIDAIVFDLEI